MAKNKLILAIDIGSSSIKLSEFSYNSSGTMTLEKYVYVEYTINQDDTDAHFIAMEKAFNEALSKNKFKAKNVYLSISGQSTFIRFVKLPPTTNKEQKIQQLVAYEAKQNVPYPIDEVTWDHQIIKNNSEELADINVMFAVVKNETINKIVNIIEKKGFVSKLVDISPAACFNTACANQLGIDECIMVLNIGCTCSTLVFIDKGKFYARTIPIAGYTITQQISREFKVSIEKAEEMKRNIGFVAPGGAYEEPESETEATISKIIRNIMTRLHGDINRSINVYRSQQKGNKPLKLYLAGGSSIITSTSDFFSEKLKIPVEYLNPFKVVKLSESLDKEEFTNVAHTTIEVIGLGLRNITTCPIEISLLPENIKKQQNIKSRRMYFIISYLIVIFCLGLIFWGVQSQKNAVEKITNSRKVQTMVTEQRLRKMKQQLKVLKDAEEKYNVTQDYLKDRNSWIDILNTIQNCLPDNTWIVELDSKQEQTKAEAPRVKRSIFGRKKVVKEPKVDESKINSWIIVKAHSLVINDTGRLTSAEIFRKNLLKTDIFSNNPNEVMIVDFRTSPEEENNIDTFHIKMKLNKHLPN